MAMYNQVFDVYHGIYRMIHILSRFDDNEIMDIDRARIWDFYILFPYKVYDIRLGSKMDDVAIYRKTYINKVSNPYNSIYDGRKLLERLRPYQMAAFTCLASYGIIDSDALQNSQIKILDKSKLLKIREGIDSLSTQEHNALSLMCLFFRIFPMNGKDGFKSRTKLLISKYDGC